LPAAERGLDGSWGGVRYGHVGSDYERCALAGRLRFTNKARDELELDDLEITDIRESLVNAVAIYKTLRSVNPTSGKREYLHIIQSPNLSGVAIYTKGRLSISDGLDTYYLLVSSKRAL
jgi:hypothetical protein